MKKILNKILDRVFKEVPILLGFGHILVEFTRATINFYRKIYIKEEKYLFLYLFIGYIAHLISNIINKKRNLCDEEDVYYYKIYPFYFLVENTYCYYLWGVADKTTAINSVYELGDKFGNMSMLYFVSIYFILSFIVLLWAYFKTKSRDILLFNISLCYGRIFIILFVIRYTIFK